MWCIDERQPTLSLCLSPKSYAYGCEPTMCKTKRSEENATNISEEPHTVTFLFVWKQSPLIGEKKKLKQISDKNTTELS